MRSPFIAWSVAVALVAAAINAGAQIGPNGPPPPSSGTAHSATLTWNAPAPVAGVTVAGYNVYRGVASGGPYGKLNTAPVTATTFVDTTATPGLQQFAVVTAVSTSGAESGWSNEVSYTLPRNPNPPGALSSIVAALVKMSKMIYAGLRAFAGFFS